MTSALLVLLLLAQSEGPDFPSPGGLPAPLPAVTSGEAQVPFPDGSSTYAEAVVAWDGVRLGGLLQRHLSLSLGTEVFGWGWVDVEGRLTAQLANRNLEVALSGLGLGLEVDNAR